MQPSINLLRHTLQGIYPPGEINGFIRLIFEALCDYTLPIYCSAKIRFYLRICTEKSKR